MKICATDVDNPVQNRCKSNGVKIWNTSIPQRIFDLENVANVTVTTDSKRCWKCQSLKHLFEEVADVKNQVQLLKNAKDVKV